MKWRSPIGILYDNKILLKLKGKFYNTAVKPIMMYESEYRAALSRNANVQMITGTNIIRESTKHVYKSKHEDESNPNHIKAGRK